MSSILFQPWLRFSSRNSKLHSHQFHKDSSSYRLYININVETKKHDKRLYRLEKKHWGGVGLKHNQRKTFLSPFPWCNWKSNSSLFTVCCSCYCYWSLLLYIRYINRGKTPKFFICSLVRYETPVIITIVVVNIYSFDTSVYPLFIMLVISYIPRSQQQEEMSRYTSKDSKS